MMMFLLSLAVADPWSRPTHIRVVQKPPKKWMDLWKDSYQFRFWWDESKEQAEIQRLGPSGWKTITKKAKPGWKTCWNYPIGSRFRLRFPSSTRWSDVIQASSWVSPLDFQLLNKKKDTLPSRPSILAATSEKLLIGSIDGGLFSFDDKQKISILRRWDGLWDDRIIGLDSQDERTLVGTANGAVLFADEKPIKAWKEEFQSPYIQAVSIQDDDLWIGSFRGLYRIRGGEFETKLHRKSVFSIHPFQEGETLIGFDGLQYFNQKDIPYSYPEWGNIYDIAVRDKEIWISSNKLGVVSIVDQVLHKKHPENPNQLLFHKDQLWMADAKGIYTPEGTWIEEFGSVFRMLHHNESLWIASNTGIYTYNDGKIMGTRHRNSSHRDALYGDQKGLIIQGAEPLQIGTPKPPTWTKSKASWHTVAIEGEWIDIATHNDTVWSLNKEGVWLHSTTKVKNKYPHRNLKNIEISALSVWAQTSKNHLLRFSLNKIQEYNVVGIQDMSSGRKSVCVASKKGLYRVWIRKDDPIELLHKDTSFDAVYSTNEGDCWFASSNDQVGILYKDGSEKVWETPPHIGTVYQLLPHDKKGIWVYSSKGLWLLRTREK